jgi:glc operon protein GlcG
MKRSYTFMLMIPMMVVLICSFPLHAQLTTKKALTLEAAKKIAMAGEAEAIKNKWTVVITIVDDGANLVYLQKMDNTQIGSIEIAIQKAKTAISFKRSTKTYEERVLKEGKNHLLGIHNIIPVEGGVPLVVDGQYIGAIGVSGGSSEQDGIVVKAAVDALPQQ